MFHLLASLRENELPVREGEQQDVKTTDPGENGVMDKMEEWLASLPTIPPTINALNHLAITPQPPAEALKRLTRLDETKGDNNKGGETWFFPP